MIIKKALFRILKKNTLKLYATKILEQCFCSVFVEYVPHQKLRLHSGVSEATAIQTNAIPCLLHETDCSTLWRFLTSLHYYTYTAENIIYTLSTRPDRCSSHSFYLLKNPQHLCFHYDIKVQILLYLFTGYF